MRFKELIEAPIKDKHYTRIGNLLGDSDDETSANYQLTDNRDIVHIATKTAPPEEDDLEMILVTASINDIIVGKGNFYHRSDSYDGEFHNINVILKYRRRGIATIMYDHMERIGYKISHSGNLQPDGSALWKYRYSR